MDGITLGKTYRDKITGFQGICTGEVKYISGCDQALLASPVKDDGSMIDPHWFDVTRLEECGGRIVNLELKSEDPTGSDIEAPIR